MADWPDASLDGMAARLVLAGGPFDGVEAAYLLRDQSPPAQIAWCGWFPWGFASLAYQWHGERTMDQGRTGALIYRPERWLTAAEVPPVMAEIAEMWADGALMIAAGFDVPKEMIWPGL